MRNPILNSLFHSTCIDFLKNFFKILVEIIPNIYIPNNGSGSRTVQSRDKNNGKCLDLIVSVVLIGKGYLVLVQSKRVK